MTAKVGDRIKIDSGKVGTPAREGEILEIMASVVGAHYRVRWTDGRETDIRPSGGSATIIPRAGGKKRG
jgi:hypothetical protein